MSMHDLWVLIPLTAIAVGPISWVANNWVRARHGFEPTVNEDGEAPKAGRQIQLLSSENERLTGQVSRLEERIAVLERIATDPATRLDREIEALRIPARAKEQG